MTTGRINASGRLAKFLPPPLTGILARRRLDTRLNEACARPLVWIGAPAGYGKSTAVADYVERRKVPHVWYRIDGRDATAASLLGGLRSDLVAHGVAGRCLPSLKRLQTLGIEEFTTHLTEAAFAALPNRAVIVLDGLEHFTADGQMHRLLDLAGGVIPPASSLVVLSRRMPPPGLRGTSADRLLALLDYRALALTEQERRAVARLYTRRRRFPQPLALNGMSTQLQGWVTGLRLVLDRVAQGVPTGFDAANCAEVHGYFDSEVFAPEPTEIQQTLLRLSAAETLDEALARRMAGPHERGTLLEDLVDGGFFLQRLATDVDRFAFHPLFRAFLCVRAARTLTVPERRRLGRVAARARITGGDLSGGIRRLEEAGDERRVAALVRRHGAQLLDSGPAQLEHWLRTLPGRMLDSDPRLRLLQGVVQVPRDPCAARPPLETAYRVFAGRSEPGRMAAAWSALADSLVLFGVESPCANAWLDELAGAGLTEALPHDSIARARLLTSAIHLATLYQPDHPSLSNWAQDLFERSRIETHPARRATLSTPVILLDALRGNTGRMLLLEEECRDLPDRPALTAAWRALASAVAGCQSAQWDSARAATEECIRRARNSDLSVFICRGYGQAVAASVSRDDLKSARRHLHAMKGVLSGTMLLDALDFDYLAAWVAHSEGDVARAFEHASNAHVSSLRLGTPFRQALSSHALAELCHARGDRAAATAHLEESCRIAERIDSALFDFACATLSAHLRMQEGRRHQALEDLARGFGIARRENLCNFPWWRSSLVTPLCLEALRAGIEVPYVSNLVRRRGLIPAEPPLDVESWPWPVRIYTLGRFALLRDGAVLECRGKTQRRPLDLLKALVTFGGRRIPAAQLMDALWPDLEADHARHALDSTLYRLRKLLGTGNITVDDARVSLNPATVWVDLWALQRQLGQLAQAADRQDVTGLEGPFAVATRLYRGDLLPDVDQTWILSSRERTRRAFMDGALGFGRHMETRGRWETALAAYRLALDLDEVAEEAHRGVMTCLLRLDRRAEGLAAYSHCRQVLARQLGIGPGRMTRSIARHLRSSA